MAKKQITQRIALEGGPEFRAGLAALGVAGQAAFKTVKDGVDQAGQAAINMAPAIAAVQKRLKDVHAAGGEFKTRFTEMTAVLGDFGRKLLEIAALAVPLSGGALLKVLLDGGKAAAEVQKAAIGLGITTTKFQEYAFAAGQADVAQDEFRTGLGRLENKVSEAQKAQLALGNEARKLQDEFISGKITNKQYNDQLDALKRNAQYSTDVFSRLGISVTNYDGSARGVDEVLHRLLEVWPELTKAQQASFASQLGFARDRTMLNVLDLGAQKFDKLVQEGRKVAPALTSTQLAVGVKLNEAVNKVTAAWESMFNAARLTFAPLITAGVEALSDRIGTIRAKAIQLAEYLAGTLRPVLTDVIKLIAGEELDKGSFVGQAVEAIKSAAEDIKSAIGIIYGAWQGLVTVLDYVADLINMIFGTHVTGRALAIVAVLGVVTGSFSAIGTAIALVIAAVGVLASTFGVAFGAVEAVIAVVGAAIGYYFGSKLREDIDNTPQIFKDAWDKVTAVVAQALDGIYNIFTGNFDTMKANFTSFVDWIVEGWNKIKEATKSAFSVGNFFPDSMGLNGGGGGFAGGGMVNGAGSSTSDSIRAWLSNGEFVVKAQAVQHYGAGFFSALNNLKIPSPAFALGGLVDALGPVMPRSHFATGGMVAAPLPNGRPVVIQIGDSQFGPFSAGEGTVNSLERFAAGRQVRSTGRKPTWKGGR